MDTSPISYSPCSFQLSAQIDYVGRSDVPLYQLITTVLRTLLSYYWHHRPDQLYGFFYIGISKYPEPASFLGVHGCKPYAQEGGFILLYTLT